MKTSLHSAALATTLALLAFPLSTLAQSSDRDAVDAVMKRFLSAYATSDNATAREVFRKDGVMIGYSAARGPGLATRTGEQFLEGFDGKPADNEAERKRRFDIVDVSKNLAAVRVTLDYPGWDGVDYVVLIKIDGKWSIASKTWMWEPKA